ncbi:MAG TPA: CYTH domain-containing protein [Candidatus Limnocylindria bacterium]|nr:CYTH domain-containing protein [Candidatus Limnocylindria bacterium]
MTSPHVEAELKYTTLDERPLQELERAERLGPAHLGVPRTVAELDRYLDTTGLRLAALRWACRLRSREGRTVVSLKGPAEHAAGDRVHRRPELEGPVGRGLDPIGWPPSAARDRLLAMAGGAPLTERFRLEQERIERSVSMGGLRVGTLSLDRVRVLRGETDLGGLLVVELEFDPANPVDHRPLAAALGRLPGLAPDPLSKFERAEGMLAGA